MSCRPRQLAKKLGETSEVAEKERTQSTELSALWRSVETECLFDLRSTPNLFKSPLTVSTPYVCGTRSQHHQIQKSSCTIR